MARRLAFLLVIAVALRASEANASKRQTQHPTCTSESDVVFVLDSSNAVSPQDYQKELDFVQQTVNRWDVGPNGVQVGLVSFGDHAQRVFNLNTYGSTGAVSSALTATPAIGGRVNLQEALRYTTDTMFTPAAGVRGQTSKVIVMVTNGQDPNKDLTILQSHTTQQNDIQVYTVGVGAGINEQELIGAASSPSTRYFYKADTFESATAISNIIGPKICNEVPRDPAFLPQPTGCLQKADVMFVLDSSSSIGKDNFRKMEDFVKDMVQDLNVAPDGVHASLMTYSSYPSLQFPLHMYDNRFDVLKATDQVSYMGGGANTADALQYMRQQGFSTNSGARTGVPRIAIVITDGSSPNSAQVAVQANNARLDNIGLVAVGVGPNINTPELQAIADDNQHMFTVNDFNRLPEITRQLIDATCTVSATAPPTSSTGSGATNGPDPCQDNPSIACEKYDPATCTSYPDWAKSNCQRFCGFCVPLHTTPAPPCDDQITNCASYGVGACIGQYQGWAQNNCARYCGYCGVNTISLGYHGKCSYKGQTYMTGEKWTDGCDYECLCEDGNTGKYRCYNRCPVYHNLPATCTLVRDPNQCCLQPKCNFQQTVSSVQGATVGNVNGISTCVYKGTNYYQGQQWQDGCDYTCTCVDSQSGHYECQTLCPTYPSLPSYCRLDKEAGSCCAHPICEFEQQQGTFTGVGTVSGNGIDSLPPTPPPCVDVEDNCAMYGQPVCTTYRSWALDHCRKFCGLCSVIRDPGPEDVCLYNGMQYHQGESWTADCSTRCTCELAIMGYYRCVDSCPTYTNVPSTCHVVSLNGSCCDVYQCGSGSFISSTNNLNTVGNGGNIFTGMSYVPPTLPSGQQVPIGTGESPNTPSSIPGCLYKGEVYVQGQRWDDACDLTCECEDAATGRYRCRARCPNYPTLPAGCSMVVDEADTCCSKPYCTGPAALTYHPIPAYGQYQSKGSVAKPPTTDTRYPTVQGPQFTGVTYVQSGTTVPPPTAGTVPPLGAIGYCIYKGQTYQQNDIWKDGCDYNCVCDDAGIGHYHCVDTCVKYTNIPQPWCHMEPDPQNNCCQIPVCNFTAPFAGFTAFAINTPATHSALTTPPPTPGFGFCEYDGKHYDHNQIWYVGCNFKCTCEEPATNNYRCVSRCTEYENLDPSCTFQPDPRDPQCCSVPVCPTPIPGTTLTPPTNPTGFVTGTNSPPGVTGGTVGFCEYNSRRYQQGERWEDGCEYNCVCEDSISGLYKCTEKCSRIDNVPWNCRLVSDFTNPCCQILKCDENAVTNTPIPGTTDSPNPNNPNPTLTPNKNAFCDYNNVRYTQDQSWMDGCDKTCRCDNAATGYYTCANRCPTYETLPAGCKLVTDPKDQCCLVPYCEAPTPGTTLSPNPTLPGQTPAPGQPTNTPIPETDVTYPTPPGVKGSITGVPNPTTVPPGQTPVPRQPFCEYKGSMYQQGQTWVDGCDYNCECTNALTGEYRCTERCAAYPMLQSNCRLVKDISNPCCYVPECGPTPLPPTSAPNPTGPNATPVPHGQTTLTPNPFNPTTLSPQRDMCVYKGQTYAQGTTWYDGCDYKCVCQNGAQGLYTCSDRCGVYDNALPTGCYMVADPSDPFCCEIPQCNIPPQYSNSTGYIFPTPPVAQVTGGRASPLPTTPPNTPNPGSTQTPLPGDATTTLAPPTYAPNVCVYNGRTYTQGQSWRDGCNYDCTCENGMTGHYSCNEICPKYPSSLPAGCYMVRDPENPCCQKPFCSTPPPTTTTNTPPPQSTLTPPQPGQPTNPPNPITTPPPKFCVYHGVNFRQGESWKDGCDLNCVCENADTGYYRCDQRCPRYDFVPAGCTLVADPRDSCCQVPICPPQPSSTPAPNTVPNGPTLYPPTTPNPLNPGTVTTDQPNLVPTAIPGKIQGQGATPTPGTTEKPNPNNPFPTYAPTQAPGCLYKGVTYHQGQTFSDGCLYDCVCVDDMSGRYTCTEKCPVYPSMPPNCNLVNDPNNPCCKIPQCMTDQPPTPSTPMPPLGQTNPPTPPPLEVCKMSGRSYTQGQQWYDGCQKMCICEDAKSNLYRCSDRCATYDQVPAGCTLVPDPNDPQCCTVPQCAPTPNPLFPNNTPGPVVVVSQPPGKVTGIAPVPTRTTGHPGDTTPPPVLGCMYKGNMYSESQRWQDGCDYNCICVDGMTGAYSCTQRCGPTGPVLPRCHLEADPNDFCCMHQVCDFSQPTSTPGVPPNPLSPTTPPPTGPGIIITPNPTNPPVCVYQGVTYQQGQSWKEGCSRTCRCEDGMNNYYSCFDRCPTFHLMPGCTLVTDPNDPCCQVPTCQMMVTPNPNLIPTKQPGVIPSVTPMPVPTAVPGVIRGTPPTPTGYCEYKGGRYSTGQHWDDGCDYRCECVDDMSGLYSCKQRCAPYPSIPPYCVMVRDQSDQCCQVPYCPGLLTQQPPTQPPLTTPPMPPTHGTGPTPPPGATTTAPPPTQPPATPFNPFPTLVPNVPPTGTSNPVPKDACIFMGKAYTQGQQFYDGCDRICICENGMTGYYSCVDRCPQYPNIAPDCIMAADPRDPTCCMAPQCPPPLNTNVPPTGVVGVVTGSGLPPMPTPIPYIPGQPSTPQPTQQNVCVYKGNMYRTGQRWQDGCALDCECINDMTGAYKCTDKCQTFPNLPTYCVLVRDPVNPCCQMPLCGDNRPTPPPTLPPTTGPNGQTAPIPTTTSPNAFCVYQGVMYRQGQTWQDGCNKVCRCEDGMTRQATCTDRCPSYPSIPDGCTLATDPLDNCCQILNCPPVLQPGTNILVPPIRAVFNGGNVPKPSGIPSMIGGPTTCVYNGQAYKQGQMWDDGCSLQCVCTDELAGKYMCTEKCPRYDNLPATCTLVTDPNSPCCKMAVCPDLKPPTTSPPPSGTTLPGQTPPPTQPTIPPPDVCVMNGNYYKQGQQWYIGCDKNCRCDDTSRNFYRCDARCAQYNNIPQGCRMVPDPKDPSCCMVPECPLTVNGIVPTVSGFLAPPLTPPLGEFTGDGKIPTSMPYPTRHPGDTTPATPQPLPNTGCYYKNMVYQKGQQWDDGCDYHCECIDDMTGAYRCTDKCPPATNALPDPQRCKYVQDPANPCCSKPYCDFSQNPIPSFPTPVTPPPGVTINYFTNPPQQGLATQTPPPPGYCVYSGVMYRQGDTWDIGCSKTCRCEDVMSGYYSCFEKCKTFGQLNPNCTLKADPNDPCCVVPDCNVVPPTSHPGQPIPTPIPHAIVGGSITGQGGNSPFNPQPGSSIGGSRNECVYKGTAYSNGQIWEDGCSYKCECMDATRGQYRCTDRCPAYYFLPQGCFYINDPNDSCCKAVGCSGTPPPYAVTTPFVPQTATPGIITSAPNLCVYKDGQKYATGATWIDGCSLNCKCEDGMTNKYICTQRCPVYTDLPTFCHLANDPADPCCQKPVCSGHVDVIQGNSLPTASPTLAPSITNVVPIPVHTVISGRSPMTPAYTGPPVTGGRNACVYKNQAHLQGETWDDACDYVCVCDDATTGDYTCTSKCPLMPPLPQYCRLITVPGLCCPSVNCDIPNHGAYNPVPQLTAQNLPTPGPTTAPHGHQTTTPSQLIYVVPEPTISLALSNLHGGQPLPPGTNVGGLNGKCVVQGRVYNPSESWDDGCNYHCTCLDGRSGYYSCEPKCKNFTSIPRDCVLVQPTAPDCCETVLCTTPNGTVVDLVKNPDMIKLYPVVTSTTTGITGFRPGFLAVQGASIEGTTPGCVYKGVNYNTHDKWDDGCDFTCECTDGTTREFLCQPKCTRYTYIPPSCSVKKDAAGCCDLLDCNPLTHTTQNPACLDQIPDCDAYGKTSCAGVYEPWARLNCAFYCGYKTCTSDMTTPAGQTTLPADCVDKAADCQNYADDACVGLYEPWARENCARRCALCPKPTHPPNGCWDKLTDCASYGADACKAPYEGWAIENCNDTCGFCNNMPPGGTQSTTPPTPTADPNGWITLMKGVHGVPNDDLLRLWSSPDTRNTNNSIAMAPTDTFPGHYKSDLSNHWDQCSFDQVKVSIWRNGHEMANVTFDAHGTNKMNWMDPTRIVASTYTDIKGSSHDSFGMQGDLTLGREFYMSQSSVGQGCAGNGWLMVSTQSNCFYEHSNMPAFYYCPGTGACTWANRQEGDVFMISAKGGNCFMNNGTVGTNQANMCNYGGKTYQTGQSWQDGCDKNCTCRDANLGYYECDDLCTRFDTLPMGCSLTKVPGSCCDTLSCAHTQHNGCYYHGVFYSQDQTWDDGCDYHCTCQDAHTGFYTCRTKCPTWNLPSVCYLDPAPAGKCCPVPVCPNGYVIQYPPGYTSEQ